MENYETGAEKPPYINPSPFEAKQVDLNELLKVYNEYGGVAPTWTSNKKVFKEFIEATGSLVPSSLKADVQEYEKTYNKLAEIPPLFKDGKDKVVIKYDECFKFSKIKVHKDESYTIAAARCLVGAIDNVLVNQEDIDNYIGYWAQFRAEDRNSEEIDIEKKYKLVKDTRELHNALGISRALYRGPFIVKKINNAFLVVGIIHNEKTQKTQITCFFPYRITQGRKRYFETEKFDMAKFSKFLMGLNPSRNYPKATRRIATEEAYTLPFSSETKESK